MEDNKSHEKVLVVVRGGVVQSIYASNENVTFDVLDFDNEDFKNQLDEELELQKRSDGLINIL